MIEYNRIFSLTDCCQCL